MRKRKQSKYPNIDSKLQVQKKVQECKTCCLLWSDHEALPTDKHSPKWAVGTCPKCGGNTVKLVPK